MEQAVRAEVDVLRARLDQIQEAVNRGESIALRVARRAQQGQREELQRELDRVNRDIFQQDADIELRTQTRDASSQVIEALKEAATDAVIKRLEHVRPLMQKIYSRIDPHPSFRHVDLIAESFRNRGQMSLHLSDAETNRRVDEPKFYLSSSQLNALSVVMFLGMNLGLSQAALNTMILDDPLQSLDDINLLGLIDLLRRVKQRRQLLISTHDRKFAALLAKKLRPVGEGQVSRVVRLGEWHRGNPEVHQHEVAVDEPRLRTVA
jgi:DNA repair exonuclease SbcCD ATPase subunit